MSASRLVRLGGKLRPVVRIYSSGIGTQYSVTLEDGKILSLTDDSVKTNPEYGSWLEICAKVFDDSITFAKPYGKLFSA